MKKFETIEELIADPLFKRNVRDALDELIKQRNGRPAPKPGFHYKRDWYDRMETEGVLYSRYFLDNIQQIWVKKSSLSSEYRAIIQYVCDNALHRTLQEYAKQDAEQKAKEAIENTEKQEQNEAN